jgi:hypothetical protein
MGKIFEPIALRSARKVADSFVASIKQTIESESGG